MKLKKLMSIGMASFMLISTLATNISFADNKETYTIALNEPYQVKEPKSVTALSVSTATALLTLATHSGITFLNSESMDEFLYRFIGLGNVGNLIEELEACIKSSAKGTINLTRSLLEEISKAFNKVTVNVDNQYSIINGGRILRINAIHSSAQIGGIIESANPSDYVHITFGLKENQTIKKQYKIGTTNYTFGGTAWYEKYYGNMIGLGMICNGDVPDFYSSTGCIYGTWTFVSEHKLLPVILGNNVGFYQAQYNTNGNITYDGSVCKKHTLGQTLVTKEINTTLGKGWSDGVGTIPGNDKTTTTDLDFQIPSNMGSLVNAPSTSVTTPTYETWKPGTDITVPSIANPGLEYTPEEVIPGGDTETDKPSTDAGSPDKPYWNILETIADFLKKIWQSILDILEWLNSFFDTLAKTLMDILSSLLNPLGVVELIYEWLLNFFDTLLEFLTYVFVPSENYFVDTFNDIKERLSQKLPNVDITKLEELGTGTKQFEDMYGTIFGQRVLLVKTSIVHKIIGIAQPIIQGVISLGLIVYNYNQIYFLIRGQKLSSARNVEGGKN